MVTCPWTSGSASGSNIAYPTDWRTVVLNPEHGCRDSELSARLTQLAVQLSPPLRSAFQLRDLDGLTTSEAARILGVPHGTVKAPVGTRTRQAPAVAAPGALDPQRAPVTCTASSIAASK